MIFRSGLDEAALGPSLGPFCACLTTFSGSSALKAAHPDDIPELYNVLSDSVTRNKKDPRRLAVADSKVLYSPSTGIRTLEAGVTAFLEAAGLSLPCSFTQLIKTLCPASDVLTLGETPWFTGAEEFQVPWNDSLQTRKTAPLPGAALKTALDKLGIKFEMPILRFVPALAFNNALKVHNGKGAALRSIITPLLEKALYTGDIRKSSSDIHHIIVDRQGGRRYYGEWLTEIIPGAPLRALEEGQKRSAYSVGNRHIEFLVGADELFMETALASMFAKYVRESAMRLFNAWWRKKIPGIHPTAGYPRDAKRFISDIKRAHAMPVNPDLLIRRL